MLLAVFSGIAMFGFWGIVLGPVLMIIIVTTIAVYLAVYKNVEMTQHEPPEAAQAVSTPGQGRGRGRRRRRGTAHPVRTSRPGGTRKIVTITIAVTNAMITHNTSATSIQAPGGGTPGRMLRSGTTANSIAAYQVANAIWNCLRPVITGRAVNMARAG